MTGKCHHLCQTLNKEDSSYRESDSEEKPSPDVDTTSQSESRYQGNSGENDTNVLLSKIMKKLSDMEAGMRKTEARLLKVERESMRESEQAKTPKNREGVYRKNSRT